MSGLLRDLRGAWRLLPDIAGLSSHPADLALGLGANAAIFAIGRGVLLRPLPYTDPDRLAMIWIRRDASPRQHGARACHASILP